MSIFGYQCPDCGQCIMQGTIGHQHANGEWIRTETLEAFWQIQRWVGALPKDTDPKRAAASDLYAALEALTACDTGSGYLTREWRGPELTQARAALAKARGETPDAPK